MKADKQYRHDVLTPITPHRRHPFYEFTIFESDRHKRADGSPCIFLAGWPKNELTTKVIAELQPPKHPDAIYSFTYDRRLMHIIPTRVHRDDVRSDVCIVKNESYRTPILKPIKLSDYVPHWSFYPKH
jgi:hypothetical protein